MTISSLRGQRCCYAPPANDLILVVNSGRFPHRIHDLENTHPPTLAEIVRLVAGFVGAVVKGCRARRERIKGKQVSRRQIEHVKVVADACTIPGIGSVTAKSCAFQLTE